MFVMFVQILLLVFSGNVFKKVGVPTRVQTREGIWVVWRIFEQQEQFMFWKNSSLPQRFVDLKLNKWCFFQSSFEVS
jgi:hypothetical protein